MSFLKDLFCNLRAGARVAVFRPVGRRDFRVTVDQVLGLSVLWVLLAVVAGYLMAEPNARYSSQGVLYLGAYFLVYLFSLLLLARLLRRVILFAPLFVVATTVGLWLSLVVMIGLVPIIRWVQLVPVEATSLTMGLSLLAAVVIGVGWSLALGTRITRLLFGFGLGKSFGVALAYGAFSLGLLMALPEAPLWVPPDSAQATRSEEAQSAGAGAKSDDGYWKPYQALSVERVYSNQEALIGRSAERLAPQRPGVADLYFVGYAGHAYQDVFMKEVMTVRALFDDRFDTKDRSVALVNNLRTVDFLPLANGPNLKKALAQVAERMDLEEDVLFLFLTSHGSEDHELSTTFWPLGLNDLSARALDDILDGSGIKWRVVVVSACYAGGFIPPLADDHSLIITAARADRNSFGCDHLNDFTYFGQAFFDQQLRVRSSFLEAYHEAVQSITVREAEEDLTPSEPQIFLGPAMAAKLDQLEARFERLTAGTPGAPDGAPEATSCSASVQLC